MGSSSIALVNVVNTASASFAVTRYTMELTTKKKSVAAKLVKRLFYLVMLIILGTCNRIVLRSSVVLQVNSMLNGIIMKRLTSQKLTAHLLFSLDNCRFETNCALFIFSAVRTIPL